MSDTMEAIVKLSEYPISIVIIGAGDSDFEMMQNLDADEAPLFSIKSQRYASRDIVQFVPFNKFKGD